MSLVNHNSIYYSLMLFYINYNHMFCKINKLKAVIIFIKTHIKQKSLEVDNTKI